MNRIVAGIILERDGKVLLIKENQNIDKGKWWIPARGVEDGELIEEAAIRETYEESGFNVKISDVLCIYNKVLRGVDPVIGIIFKGQIIDGELHFDELRNPLPILICIQMLKNGNVLPLDTILKI